MKVIVNICLLLICSLSGTTNAWISSPMSSSIRNTSLSLSDSSAAKPELPEIKGDYDWDTKFANDSDWITENVPGKMQLSEVEVAAQATALAKLEAQYKKERLQKEYDAARILGWTSKAETFNGRFAMFFLVVGLLTEYWTGVSIPGQIEEMLRVGGFIGPDY